MVMEKMCGRLFLLVWRPPEGVPASLLHHI